MTNIKTHPSLPLTRMVTPDGARLVPEAEHAAVVARWQALRETGTR